MDIFFNFKVLNFSLQAVQALLRLSLGSATEALLDKSCFTEQSLVSNSSSFLFLLVYKIFFFPEPLFYIIQLPPGAHKSLPSMDL